MSNQAGNTQNLARQEPVDSAGGATINHDEVADSHVYTSLKDTSVALKEQAKYIRNSLIPALEHNAENSFSEGITSEISEILDKAKQELTELADQYEKLSDKLKDNANEYRTFTDGLKSIAESTVSAIKSIFSPGD